MAFIRRSRKTSQVYPKIMGLDASLNSSGYSYRDGGRVVTGTIKPGTKRGSARLWHNLKNLERILDAVKPDVMVIEGYAMGVKGGRVFNIGEWGGVARLAAWQRGIKVVTVTPSSLKMVVSGSGAPGKGKLQAAVTRMYGVVTKQDDELDALGLLAIGEALEGARGCPLLNERLRNVLNGKKPGIESEPGMR